MLTAPASCWLLLAAPGYSWWLMAASGGSWLLWQACCQLQQASWQFPLAHGKLNGSDGISSPAGQLSAPAGQLHNVVAAAASTEAARGCHTHPPRAPPPNPEPSIAYCSRGRRTPRFFSDLARKAIASTVHYSRRRCTPRFFSDLAATDRAEGVAQGPAQTSQPKWSTRCS